MKDIKTFYVNKTRFFLFFILFLGIVFLTVYLVRKENINWTIAIIEGGFFACFFQMFIQWKYIITEDNHFKAKNIIGITLNDLNIKDISMIQIVGELEAQLYHSRGMFTPNPANKEDMNSLIDEIKTRNPEVKIFIQEKEEE